MGERGGQPAAVAVWLLAQGPAGQSASQPPGQPPSQQAQASCLNQPPQASQSASQPQRTVASAARPLPHQRPTHPAHTSSPLSPTSCVTWACCPQAASSVLAPSMLHSLGGIFQYLRAVCGFHYFYTDGDLGADEALLPPGPPAGCRPPAPPGPPASRPHPLCRPVAADHPAAPFLPSSPAPPGDHAMDSTAAGVLAIN